ncbi:hypothetical protein NBRGN_038_00610 [Nocardia brasiliensis NBRC 14402]|nr:hypothetical protein NBRGN_038_00610 [Nocardia brasiliensis NBRC 14402]
MVRLTRAAVELWPGGGEVAKLRTMGLLGPGVPEGVGGVAGDLWRSVRAVVPVEFRCVARASPQLKRP